MNINKNERIDNILTDMEMMELLKEHKNLYTMAEALDLSYPSLRRKYLRYQESLTVDKLEEGVFAENKLKSQTDRHIKADNAKKISLDGKLSNLYKIENPGRYVTLISGSDFHDIECDEFTLKMFLHVLKDKQPEIVCLNGDVFDFPEFGRWTKDPRDYDLKGRFDFAYDNVLRAVRNACPNAQIDFNAGNHDERLRLWLADNGPAVMDFLESILGLTTNKLFKLDELNINYNSKANLKAWSKRDFEKEIAKNYLVYFDMFVAHHYPFGKALGLPGVNGHHHKYHAEQLYNHTFGSYSWVQAGSFHRRSASYCEGEKWSTGFLISYLDTKDKKVYNEYIDTTNGFCLYNGQFFNLESFK